MVGRLKFEPNASEEQNTSLGDSILLNDEGLPLDVVAYNYFFEIGDRIEFIKEVIQAEPDRPPKWKTKQVKSA